jgi:hypothetical protein
MTFLSLLLLACAQDPGFIPHFAYPDLAVTSSPAQQTIIAPTSSTMFNQAATVHDDDTFFNPSTYQTQLVPNVSIEIIATIRSGNPIGGPNVTTGADGTLSYLWTIRPHIPTVTTDYIDSFYGRDYTDEDLTDVDSSTLNNTVTIVIPVAQGGGGGGSGGLP